MCKMEKYGMNLNIASIHLFGIFVSVFYLTTPPFSHCFTTALPKNDMMII